MEIPDHIYTTFFDRALKLLSRARFKYDVFISYRREEASTYAKSLSERLKESGYRCFLDYEELPPGHRLSDSLRGAIRRSNTFVLIGSQKALESEYVQLEVQEFAGTRRLLLPIDIGDSIARFPGGQIIDRDLIRIPETQKQFESGVPALRVTDEIDRSFRGIRVRTRRLMEAASLALAVLAIVSATAYVLNKEVLRNKALLADVKRELSASQSALTEAKDDAAAAVSQAAGRSLLLQAQDAWDKHDPDLAIALALEAAETDRSSREAESTLAGWAYAPGTRRVFSLDEATAVSSLALSADGSRALSGKPDGTVILWDVAMAKPIRFLKRHSQEVKSLAFSPDGRLALSGSFDGAVILWQVASGKALYEWKATTREAYAGSNVICGLVFTPDGKFAFSASQNNSVCRFNLLTGEKPLCHRWPDTQNGIDAIAISLAGDVAVVGTEVRKTGPALILWNVQSFAERKRWAVQGGVLNIAFQPDGQAVVATHGGGPRLTRFNVEGRVIQTWDYKVNDWVISPDGKRTLGASSNRSLIELDLRTGKTRELWGHQAGVTKVVYGPGGSTALSGSLDGTLRLWDLTPGNIIRRLPGTWPVALNRTGDAVASSSGVWSLENGQRFGKGWSTEDCTTPDYTSRMSALVFSPDGRELLSGWSMISEGGSSMDRKGFCSLVLWDLQRGSTVKRFAGGKDVKAVAFSPSGHEVFSAAFGSLTTWNTRTGEPMRRQIIGEFISFAFSDDGSRYATGSSDGTVRIFATAKGGTIHRLGGQGAKASALAFGPDGRLLLCGFENGQVRLFDLKSGAEIRAWKRHAGPVRSVAISRRGRFGLSGSDDGSVLLTNLEAAAGGRILATHRDSVGTVDFGAGDRTAVSASDDGIVVSGIGAGDELIPWTKVNRHMRK